MHCYNIMSSVGGEVVEENVTVNMFMNQQLCDDGDVNEYCHLKGKACPTPKMQRILHECN